MIDIDTLRFYPIEDDEGELVCSERGPTYHRVAGLIDADDAREIIDALKIAKAAREFIAEHPIKHLNPVNDGMRAFNSLVDAVRGEPEAKA